MSIILDYSDWKRLYEQAEEEATSTDSGASEIASTEVDLYNGLVTKINTDTREKINIMGKITDDNTKKGIVESFIHWKNLPKKFLRELEKYKFVAGHVGIHIDFPSISGEDGTLKYIDTDGAEKVVKNISEILDDINTKNIDLFATGEDTQFSILVESYSEGKKRLKRFKAVSSTFPDKLVTILEGRVPVFTSATATSPGKDSKSTPGSDGIPIKIVVPLPVSDTQPGTTFAVGKADLTNSQVTTDIVWNAIQEALKKNNIVAGAKIQITSVKIISSASNYWGGIVTPTYKNDGTPTGQEYSAVPPTRANDTNYTTHAESNYKLATNRGLALSTAVVAGLKAKGIAEIAEPLFDTRVTDTGGVNDDKRVTTTYPNPGQFAKIIITAKTTDLIPVPIPGKKITTFQLTQFTLALVGNTGTTNPKLDKVRGWSIDRPKYLKKSGGWKSGGYIKRHGGANRPFNGLSHLLSNALGTN